MPPVPFGDFSKSVTDLFDKSGFGADKKIKQTFKTAPVLGGPVTVSTEVKNFTDYSKGYNTKVSAKWKHSCGFSVDKFDNDLSKGTVLETSFNKFAVKGLSVSANMTRSYGDKGKATFPVELKYENDMLASSLATDTSLSSLTANLTLAHDGLTVGTSLKFKDGIGAPSDYPISLSYSSKSYVAAIEATNELKTFTLLGSYKATPELTVAAKFMVPDGDKKNMSLVGIFNTGDSYGTKVAAMYSDSSEKAKTLECAVTAKPVQQVEAGCALALPLKEGGALKWGLTFTLG